MFQEFFRYGRRSQGEIGKSWTQVRQTVSAIEAIFEFRRCMWWSAIWKRFCSEPFKVCRTNTCRNMLTSSSTGSTVGGGNRGPQCDSCRPPSTPDRCMLSWNKCRGILFNFAKDDVLQHSLSDLHFVVTEFFTQCVNVQFCKMSISQA